MHQVTQKIIKRFLVFVSVYEKTTISVKNCLKFDCPLAFIDNKGVLQPNMFSVFLALWSANTLLLTNNCTGSTVNRF